MAALGFLFVDPEALPGGDCFSPNCPKWNNSTCNYANFTKGVPHNYPDCDENSAYGFVQLLFLGAVYGVILSVASDMISDGSELLLLVPSLKGLVGSVVLPILGAVPDGAIVLFSGIGKNAAASIQVGVGALAGSTIMLITLPWFIAVYAGRVPIVGGKCIYSKKQLRQGVSAKGSQLFSTGVDVDDDIHIGGKLMGGTALLFLTIQIPAFIEISKYGSDDLNTEKYGKDITEYEHNPFLVGTILCFLGFFAYLAYQVKVNQDGAVAEAKAEKQTQKALGAGTLTLAGAFFDEFSNLGGARVSMSRLETDGLLGSKANSKLECFLKKKFKAYDKDCSGTLDQFECNSMFSDFGEPASRFKELTELMDKDGDGLVNFDEFYTAMQTYLANTVKANKAGGGGALKPINDVDTGDTGEDGEDDEDDEEDEMPEDIAALKTPEEQQHAIKMRSLYMMSVGTIVVLLVSDPAVDVLSSLGNRTGIPPFYISFILAPMASNASELIAAYNYARKKTRDSISISLSTLEGAGIMNNTFCTGIFFLVIYINDDISWTFSAETMAILLVQLAVMLVAQKKIITLFDAYLVLSLYPLSLFFIAILKAHTKLK